MTPLYGKKHAVYRVTYWDADWNEIPMPPQVFTAAALVNLLERWNLVQQRVAQDDPFTITSLPHAVSLTIGVEHVER